MPSSRECKRTQSSFRNAVFTNNITECCKLLNATPGLINMLVISRTQVTALIYAAMNGNNTMVHLLLSCKGIDVNQQSHNKNTALSWAAGRGYQYITRLLIEKGANITLADRESRTPLHWAACNGHLDTVMLILLQSNQTNVNAYNKHGWTPLHLASQGGYVEIVKNLLQNGAYKDQETTNEKHTSASLSSSKGHVQVVDVLLSNNAHFATSNKAGFNPLHLASMNGHTAVIQKIMSQVQATDPPPHDQEIQDRKQYIRILTKNSFTAIQLAALFGHVESFKLLKEYGANPMLVNKLWHKTAFELLDYVLNEQHRQSQGSQLPQQCLLKFLPVTSSQYPPKPPSSILIISRPLQQLSQSPSNNCIE